MLLLQFQFLCFDWYCWYSDLKEVVMNLIFINYIVLLKTLIAQHFLLNIYFNLNTVSLVNWIIGQVNEVMITLTVSH